MCEAIGLRTTVAPKRGAPYLAVVGEMWEGTKALVEAQRSRLQHPSTALPSFIPTLFKPPATTLPFVIPTAFKPPATTPPFVIPTAFKPPATTLPFVIPTGAKRSGGIRSRVSRPLSTLAFQNVVDQCLLVAKQRLLSQPARSQPPAIL